MPTDPKTMAWSYLKRGKVAVLDAARRQRALRADYVYAEVEGHSARYLVERDGRGWTCTCDAETCAHVAAVQLVTGYPSPAVLEKRGGESR